MFLLHPPVAPWLLADAAGLELVLLAEHPVPDGRAFVRALPDNEELLVPMRHDGRDGALHRLRARIAWDGGNRLTRYAFVVVEDDGGEGRHHWLGADGPQPVVPAEAMHFRVHPAEAPPAWVNEQVFYQVFPDRFARGSQAAGPCTTWGEPPDPRRGGSQRFGGDLAGVLQRLPYLQEQLGASAVYLNPVFTSRSNHRYDTDDYFAVDPALGGDAALAALREATRARGMRLVLDAVLNHTGTGHPWLVTHPDRYARDAAGGVLGWKGHASLPVLDFAAPGVAEAMYEGPRSVLRHWLRPPFAIDGWRLDVIHMLGEGTGSWRNAAHVRAMRRAVREENPEAYLLGEHFAEATRWLQGEQEDGAMNYHGFMFPLRAWLAGAELGGVRAQLPTAAFVHALERARAPLPHANQLAQLNLLGSHDTPRIAHELGSHAGLLALATTLLFTWPGVPCVYYGDEIGLPGGPDPDNRRCFPWPEAGFDAGQRAHLGLHRALARLRRSRAELQRGATLVLAHGPDWIAFARYDAHAAALVLANRGEATRAVLPLARLPVRGSGWRPAPGLGQGDAPGAGSAWLLPARSAQVWLSD